MARWVMVDDTDPSIEYAGDWFADTGNLDSSGDWGPPYLSTVHGTRTQGSFSYDFSGSALTLTGAIQVPRSSSSANTTWECLVDGISITGENPASVNNRVRICAGSGLADGPHTLQVNAQGSSAQMFWFDHLQYQPSASVSLADAAIYIDRTDPIFDFGTGWVPGFTTDQAGATLDFEFNGVSFTWYGFYEARFPFAVSTASYAIDGAAPVNFTLNGVTAQQTSVQYSQVFFTTDTLSPGDHKVVVTYNGNADTTSLSLQVVIVQNGTITSAGGTIGATSGGRTTPTPGSITANGSASHGQSSGTARSDTGAIVGGVVGGVAFLLLAALLFFWMSRHTRPTTVATPFRSPPSSTQSPRAAQKGNELQQPLTRVVPDVDSGIRRMAVHGDNSEMVHVLPPVYSQI
ncbi:hypothetical protein BJ912DRAFT_863161 [Pholiota molesta]|nr:hypothetical protein BJ912DRAFT_863161 [Pholiota molesta]